MGSRGNVAHGGSAPPSRGSLLSRGPSRASLLSRGSIISYRDVKSREGRHVNPGSRPHTGAGARPKSGLGTSAVQPPRDESESESESESDRDESDEEVTNWRLPEVNKITTTGEAEVLKLDDNEEGGGGAGARTIAGYDPRKSRLRAKVKGRALEMLEAELAGAMEREALEDELRRKERGIVSGPRSGGSVLLPRLRTFRDAAGGKATARHRLTSKQLFMGADAGQMNWNKKLTNVRREADDATISKKLAAMMNTATAATSSSTVAGHVDADADTKKNNNVLNFSYNMTSRRIGSLCVQLSTAGGGGSRAATHTCQQQFR